MKTKINIILPIALAVILPGLTLYSNSDLGLLLNLGFFGNWAVISTYLYIIWYLLWFSWNVKSRFKKGWFILAIVIFICLILLLAYMLVPEKVNTFKVINLFRIVLTFILFLSIQYALKAQDNIARLSLEKEQLQTENYKTQLKALRAQIDPHFLFNSLNTLRSMVRQHHSHSEKFIMSLSDFYRQTLRHNENSTLLLSEELAVLKSYLFVMKSRNEEAVSVTFDIDESINQFHLPTLALQVVVENCFKHNSMTTRNPLKIEIYSTEDDFIVVKNNIQPKMGEKDSSGLGLDMLRKRYELLNITQGVVVEESPCYFSVKLKLIN